MEKAADASIRSIAGVSGGDVSKAYRVELDDGRTVFAKSHESTTPGFYATEASGLEWLRATGTLRIPRVVAVADAPAMLMLEWIEPGSRRRNTESDLGRGLVALHGCGAPCFGREDRATTGSRRLPNEPSATWTEFFAGQRLLPLASMAREVLGPTTCAAMESIATRLSDMGGTDEPPARLHGDLWAGNRLVDVEGRSVLIDPAAHGGHREFDLAMMRLFGGFDDDVFAAYDEAFPLSAGWEDRVLLHQIPPLVVHAIKFGGSYIPAARAAVDRYA